MNEYQVTFVKYYTYYVEAVDSNEAIDIAEIDFRTDTHTM